MTAKEYLNQVRSLEFKVSQRKKQVAELKQAAQLISSPSTGERVQVSQTGGALEKAVEKYIGLAETAELQAISLNELKDEIITRIEKTDDSRLLKILTFRYLDYLTFEEIAVKMNYSFRQVCRLHRKGLEDFERNNKDVL